MEMARKTSIDRLTIMGSNIGILKGYINLNSYLYYEGFSKNYGFRYAYKGLNGELLEVGNKEKIRIDFNPNKANMDEIKKILSCIKHPYLTRLDIAIDYFGIDLSGFQWTSEKLRKRNIWTDFNGVLETLYIGAPSSEKRYRIYNKLQEQIAKGEKLSLKLNEKHWRVEVQKRFTERENLKDGEYLLEDLFDIKPYSKDLNLDHIENPRERIMLRGILSNKNELSCLNAKTKTKYRKLMRESIDRSGKSLKIVPPIDIYQEEREALKEDLISIIENCSYKLAF
ncbi:hypothetical protein P4797_20785 [Priestia aryabhattai]|uniref:hypothetical protein n=1 Tax=Priestia aryabhattai TaxID=412384 RepID=UPI002E244EC2|nr:hypothetical protein [Priestia aryabhattai]